MSTSLYRSISAVVSSALFVGVLSDTELQTEALQTNSLLSVVDETQECLPHPLISNLETRYLVVRRELAKRTGDIRAKQRVFRVAA